MTSRTLRFAGLVVAVLLTACADRTEPIGPAARPTEWLGVSSYTPSPLTPVTLAGSDLQVWPFTADSFPAHPVDPINLVFVGPYNDPRQIRAALLGLGGDRSALGLPPALMPGVFDCRWADGIGGGEQAAYVQGRGWMGSAIQLTCGPYDVFRFHLRLFRFGNVTLGGAHFEMNIPGTPNHESLSWELARNVVAADLMLAGRAAPLGNVTMGSPAPTYRSVRPEIYNSSPALQGLLAQLGNQGAAIANSGQATVLQLAQPPAAAPGAHTVYDTITMRIPIPKPFCNPGDLLFVTGQLFLSQTTTVTASGDYSSAFETKGTVDVLPINPDYSPTGAPAFQAKIGEVDGSLLTDWLSQTTQVNVQAMTPPAPGRGTQVLSFVVGPGSLTQYSAQARCY